MKARSKVPSAAVTITERSSARVGPNGLSRSVTATASASPTTANPAIVKKLRQRLKNERTATAYPVTLPPLRGKLDALALRRVQTDGGTALPENPLNRCPPIRLDASNGSRRSTFPLKGGR